ADQADQALAAAAAHVAHDTVDANPRIGLVNRMDRYVDVRPQHLARAAVVTQPIQRGQRVRRDVRTQPRDGVAVVVVMRRLDQDEMKSGLDDFPAHMRTFSNKNPRAAPSAPLPPYGVTLGQPALPSRITQAFLRARLGCFREKSGIAGLYAALTLKTRAASRARRPAGTRYEQECIVDAKPGRQAPVQRKRSRRECHRARSGAAAVPHPEFSLPVAGRPAGLVGLRDGEHHSGLVRARLDRFGAGACDLRLAAIPRHADFAALWHGGRPHRQSGAALRDARPLPRRVAGADG